MTSGVRWVLNTTTLSSYAAIYMHISVGVNSTTSHFKVNSWAALLEKLVAEGKGFKDL